MHAALLAFFGIVLGFAASSDVDAGPPPANAVAATSAIAEYPSMPPEGRISFRVMRDDIDIGSHRVTFRRTDERLHVDVTIDFNVTFLGISLYRYSHRASETWRDGRLLALESATDSNGRVFTVTGHASEQGFIVSTEKGETVFPADALPSSHWNRRWIEGVALINTQNGERIDFTASPAGHESVRTDGGSAMAERFAIAGDLRKDIWFDAQGRWLSTRFAGPDGSTISYLRQ